MILDKKQMSEEDIKLQFITPAIVSKWTLDRITTETKVTDGQINLKGNFVVRSPPKRADYVLYISQDKALQTKPIAIVEAKGGDEYNTYNLIVKKTIDGALRIGLCRFTTQEDIDALCEGLRDAHETLAHR